MFKKALLVTDASDFSEHFLRCKAGLRHLGVEEIVVGFCVRLLNAYGGSRPVLASLQSSIEEIFKAELARQREALENQGYAVKIELLIGDPRTGVDRLSDAEGCDLIVVGSRMHSVTSEMFLGGVAGEILHRCRKPLLVGRVPVDDDRTRECPLAALDSILFPTDFSENAEHAFASVVSLAQETRGTVVLLHIQDRTKIDRHLQGRLEEFNAIDRERLERMKEALLSRGAQNVQIELPYGLPAEEILRRTRRGDISLTIMGSQGRGFFSEVFLGSVSHNIARNAPVPVLLIPALRRDEP